MKLKVPFYKSIKDTDCGPVVLKMALEYLGEKHDLQELSQLERQLDTGLVWSIGIARAAQKLGFPVKIISITNFDHNENIDYYEKYRGDKGKLILEELKKEIKELGIETEEKDLSLQELFSFLTKNSIPIVLVNWSIIKGKPGYQGHFLVISGYDKENVFVHNPGIEKASAYMPIPKDLFIKMWESKGTDKDTVIISKKIATAIFINPQFQLYSSNSKGVR